MFQEPLKVRIDKEEGKVFLSIRQSDNTVVVHIFELSAFELMVAHFRAALEDDE
jgi:hypothetical protein